MDIDGDYEVVTDTVLSAVFGGAQWSDMYLGAAADLGGVNDFAQAVDDARAVINFMHEQLGAVEVSAPLSGVASVTEVSVELVGVSGYANSMFAADFTV